MDDFDIAQSKIGESAQRVLDRAVEESRRRDHALLTNEHIFLAFAQVEWDTFSQVMRDLELNPHEILQALEEHLTVLSTGSGGELHVSSATTLVFKLALHQVSRAGRRRIEFLDLLSALFEERHGFPATILRRQGIEPEVVVSRVAKMAEESGREERGQPVLRLLEKLDATARELLSRVIEEAWRRGHARLTNDHCTLVIARKAWALFVDLFAQAGVDPLETLFKVQSRLEAVPRAIDGECAIAPSMREMLDVAFETARVRGLHSPQALDLLLAIMRDVRGPLSEVAEVFQREHRSPDVQRLLKIGRGIAVPPLNRERQAYGEAAASARTTVVDAWQAFWTKFWDGVPRAVATQVIAAILSAIFALTRWIKA